MENWKKIRSGTLTMEMEIAQGEISSIEWEYNVLIYSNNAALFQE